VCTPANMVSDELSAIKDGLPGVMSEV